MLFRHRQWTFWFVTAAFNRPFNKVKYWPTCCFSENGNTLPINGPDGSDLRDVPFTPLLLLVSLNSEKLNDSRYHVVC